MKPILKAIFVAGAVVTVGGFVFASSVNAQTINKEQISDQVKEKRCDLITKRIDNQTKIYELRKDNVISRYNFVKERTTEILNKLNDDKGFKYDTQKLSNDLKDLDSKLQKYGSDVKALEDILNNSKQYECNNSNGSFKSEMEKAKKQLEIVNADAKDIRKFANETIKQDIKDVRNQNPNKK